MYTPAPWYTKTKEDDAQGLVISEVTGANVAVTYHPRDAAIVAAAPELLEACEAVLSALESHQAYDKDCRPQLHAAIAKARGEA